MSKRIDRSFNEIAKALPRKDGWHCWRSPTCPTEMLVTHQSLPIGKVWWFDMCKTRRIVVSAYDGFKIRPVCGFDPKKTKPSEYAKLLEKILAHRCTNP